MVPESTRRWFAAIRNRDVNTLINDVSKYARTKNEAGLTGLMVAAAHDLLNIVLMLFNHESHGVDNSGKTALMHACIHGNKRCVRALIVEAGAYDNDGHNAFFYAVANGHKEIVAFILSHPKIAKVEVTPRIVHLLKTECPDQYDTAVKLNQQYNFLLNGEPDGSGTLRAEPSGADGSWKVPSGNVTPPRARYTVSRNTQTPDRSQARADNYAVVCSEVVSASTHQGVESVSLSYDKGVQSIGSAAAYGPLHEENISALQQATATGTATDRSRLKDLIGKIDTQLGQVSTNEFVAIHKAALESRMSDISLRQSRRTGRTPQGTLRPADDEQQPTMPHLSDHTLSPEVALASLHSSGETLRSSSSSMSVRVMARQAPAIAHLSKATETGSRLDYTDIKSSVVTPNTANKEIPTPTLQSTKNVTAAESSVPSKDVDHTVATEYAVVLACLPDSVLCLIKAYEPFFRALETMQKCQIIEVLSALNNLSDALVAVPPADEAAHAKVLARFGEDCARTLRDFSVVYYPIIRKMGVLRDAIDGVLKAAPSCLDECTGILSRLADDPVWSLDFDIHTSNASALPTESLGLSDREVAAVSNQLSNRSLDLRSDGSDRPPATQMLPPSHHLSTKVFHLVLAHNRLETRTVLAPLDSRFTEIWRVVKRHFRASELRARFSAFFLSEEMVAGYDVFDFDLEQYCAGLFSLNIFAASELSLKINLDAAARRAVTASIAANYDAFLDDILKLEKLIAASELFVQALAADESHLRQMLALVQANFTIAYGVADDVCGNGKGVFTVLDFLSDTHKRDSIGRLLEATEQRVAAIVNVRNIAADLVHRARDNLKTDAELGALQRQKLQLLQLHPYCDQEGEEGNGEYTDLIAKIRCLREQLK